MAIGGSDVCHQRSVYYVGAERLTTKLAYWIMIGSITLLTLTGPMQGQRYSTEIASKLSIIWRESCSFTLLMSQCTNVAANPMKMPSGMMK
jgi:hypothetical protein